MKNQNKSERLKMTASVRTFYRDGTVRVKPFVTMAEAADFHAHMLGNPKVAHCDEPVKISE